MHDVLGREPERPLGAFERIIDLYIQRNPVHFSLVCQLPRAVPATEMEAALVALRESHPLLGATVDRSGSQPRFVTAPGAIPVRTTDDTSWQREAALEQSIPFDASGAPLLRATLVHEQRTVPGSTVLLTFSHQIADGRGALQALHDLLKVLEGQDIAPRSVPLSQEALLQDTAVDAVPDGDSPAPKSAPTPARSRPFDGRAPVVESSELTVAATDQLREAARAHGCTVQAALCAAAASVLLKDASRNAVRINVPIDLRQTVGSDDDIVVRFTATTVSIDRFATTFWDAARIAAAQLRAAQAPAAARAAALGLAALPVTDIDAAERAMLAATHADIEITNLGASSEARGATAIWGPTMTTQVADEQVLGVVTHDGRMRLTLTAHDHQEGLLDGITGQLLAARA